MRRAIWPWVALVLGIAVTIAALFGNRLGLSTTPGFTWGQSVSVIIGLALISIGLWPFR